MGQSTPEPFLEKLLADYPAVRDLTICSHGREAYFTVQSPLMEVSVIMEVHRGGKRWRKPQIASFSGMYSDLEPALSPDGLSLYFASKRPTTPASDEPNYDIWVVTRSNKGAAWSEPVNLGAPINSEHNEFYPISTRSGNLYFTTDRPGTLGKDDILVSHYSDGQFHEPINVSDSINTAGYEFNAYVAPNESYLLFTAYNRPDGSGSGDLYISHQTSPGQWTKAQNLGSDINSPQMDYCPFIINNKLYFTSRRSQVEAPRSGFHSSYELLNEISQHENGQSRLYVVPWKGNQSQ